MRGPINFNTGAPQYVVRCMSRAEGEVRKHIYLLPKKRRTKFNWSSLLRAAVYDSFEAALKDAQASSSQQFQIVPVGYCGPPYWVSRKHVRHNGPMARFHNPRIFLVDKKTGKQIEV